MSKEIAKINQELPKILQHYIDLQKDVNSIEVKAIKGFHNKLSKSGLSEGALKSKLGLLIGDRVIRYGGAFGRKEEDKDVMTEFCVSEILDKWMHFGFEDIEAAFDMWGTGEIGDNSTNMYNGLFNVMILNRIFAFYEKRRIAVINDFGKKMEIQAILEKEKEDEKRYNEWITNYTEEQIVADAKKYETWEKLPFYLAKLCFQRKIFILTPEEIENYKKESEILAKKEAEKEKPYGHIPTKLIGKTNKELMDNLNDRTKTIAYKLAAFEKLKTYKPWI